MVCGRILILSVGSGIGIFVKRVVIGKMRSLSNPDDYLSNLLVTLFQLSTLLMMVQDGFAAYILLLPLFFCCTSP